VNQRLIPIKTSILADTMRNLISLTNLTPTDLDALVRRAIRFGGPEPADKVLAGHSVGLLFNKPSTRTRTSFWAGASRLGADVITFGPGELQLSTGESIEDTARVLGEYLDALVIRTNGDVTEMRRLGRTGELAVVNALSWDEHPTQAVADLATVTEEFGGLAGRHLLYAGEGNSTAAALALGAALTPGFRLSLVCPPGYGLPEQLSGVLGELSGGLHQVGQYESFDEVTGPVDALYTSRWQTMGVPKANPSWLWDFKDYRVDTALFKRFSGPDTVFLHDLPAVRGQEVEDAVLDSPSSRAWRQAHHKMTAAMAVLEWCVA
jgi:ornithine carbamoyltransferase